MRFLLVLTALAAMLIQPAAAITACPESQFVIAFEPNSAELTTEGAEALAASYDRARTCENAVFTLLTSGRDPVGRDRAARTRSDLFALGLSAATQIMSP